jgi:hypothetical protein
MGIDDSISARINVLLGQSEHLKQPDDHQYDQITNPSRIQECFAWLVAAQNVIHLVFSSSLAPYRKRIDRVLDVEHGYGIHHAVGEVAAILRALRYDAEKGLLASVASQVAAEIFDDFLDHADAYLKARRKNEAGAVSGIVVEDTIRRICRKNNIPENGVKLDSLISELAARDHLSGIQAKRARAAAHVRTKASHAQWDQFETEDVHATITFTRELIASKLDQ